MNESPLKIAVIGAGPVGLALALQAARSLPDAQVTLFDARAATADVSGDPRTLALSLGSVQLLERLDAWVALAAQPILEVHVSQQPPSALTFLPAPLTELIGEPELRIRALDEAVPMLGAVVSYGALVTAMQAVWAAAVAAQPQRLHSRFGTPVAALKNLGGAAGSGATGVWGVEVDAGIVDTFDLAVVAEGGVFGGGFSGGSNGGASGGSNGKANDASSAAARQALGLRQRAPITHDYQQTAWVGQVRFAATPGAPARASGVAFERFTRHGPVALLPLKNGGAALVWCVPSDDDGVAALDDAQRVTVLNTIFHASVGQIESITPLKHFALGLNAERTLTEGRSVRIGNAAQTLHPVAGQGLNLGLRDAFELVQALARSPDVDAVLRRLEWQRGPDRWAMIAATDFLARSFTWKLPGGGAARGLGLAALQALRPLKSALARQMMFGRR